MAEKSDLLREVMNENRALLRRARELNLRAGEPVFPVPSRAELEAWIASKLSGARSAAEIPEVEALRLSPLDEELSVLVVRENPDAVEILGREARVEYREGCLPRISLRWDDLADHSWQALPDEGVRLPGGRSVEVTINFGWSGSFSDREIPSLKRQVREYLNAGQWNNWQRPAMATPTVDGEEFVPDVTAVEYGRCVVTGEPLLAYGTVAVRGYNYYSSTSWFEVRWCRDRAEAETAHAAAAKKLAELRAEVEAQREVVTARAEAEDAKQELRALYQRCPYASEADSLYVRLYQRAYNVSFPDDASRIRQWMIEAKALFAEAEKFIVGEEGRREAQAREREERERVEREAEAKAQAEAFPRAVLACAKGNIQRAIRILEDELNAPYGRARRQDAIRRNLSGIETTEAGQRFLARCRASDVDEDLSAAIAWLQNQAAPKVKATAEEPAPVVAEEKAPGNSIDALRKAWGAR